MLTSSVALMPKRLKKFLLSPIGGLLILSTCTLAWCAFQIIAPPPFGINTGWVLLLVPNASGQTLSRCQRASAPARQRVSRMSRA